MGDGTAGLRDELGAMLRALADASRHTAASDNEITAALAHLDSARVLLTEPGTESVLIDNPFHPGSLVGGTAHPFAPQLRLREQSGGGVAGTVTLGPRFEGGPGLVHGGALALLFDHAMGTALYVDGHGSMTRSLDIRYLAPTPLGVELTVRARMDRSEGRRRFVSAEIEAAGVRTAQAHAVFVQLTRDNVAAIFPDRLSADELPGA